MRRVWDGGCFVSLEGRPQVLSKQQEELQKKGRDQRWLSERYGKREHEHSNHPQTKRSGYKGASNVGEDESSGSE